MLGSSRWKGFVGAAAALVVGAGLGAVPAGAAPVNLSCGAVVTTSIVLGNDIGPCHEDGIIVAANNITVDLNHHQVFGEGGANVIHQAAGVFSDNHTGVVVKNGTIHDFYHGVRIRQGSHNRVTGLTVRDNVGGDGIVFESSADNLADHNLVVHNGRFGGIATFDTNSLPPGLAQRNTISDNILHLNNGVLFGSVPSSGISVENGAGHVVRGNVVDSSGRDGIALLSGANHVLVELNRVNNNGAIGISIRNGSHDNVVRRNQAIGNALRGILVAGTSNQILGNVALRNGLRDLEDTSPGGTCDANVWSANTFGTALPACAQG